VNQRFSGVCIVLLPEEDLGVVEAHVTLHFLGRASDYMPEEIDTMAHELEAFARSHGPQPVMVSGEARFYHPEGPVPVWTVDGLTLGGLRHELRAQFDGWRRVREVHGFIPHITVPDGYDGPLSPIFHPFPVTLSRVALWGGRSRFDFALTG
jgi:2'-5' RNA ligase